MAPGQNLLAAQPSARSLPYVDGEESPLKDFCSQHYAFFFFFKCLFIMAALGLTCGIWDLVPRPGFEPKPPSLGACSPSHWTTREVPPWDF